MPLDTTPLTPVDTVTADLYPPKPGTNVNASDVAAGEQVLWNHTNVILYRHTGLNIAQIVGKGAAWSPVIAGPDGIAIQRVAVGVQATALLDFPHHGVKVATIKVRVIPAGGHVGLPGTFPQLRLFRINANGVADPVLATVNDTAVDVPTYETPHDLTITLGPLEIDKTFYYYFLLYTQESGANALDGDIGQPRLALTPHSP